MHDDNRNAVYESDRQLTLLARPLITSGKQQRIVKDALGLLETDVVLTLICPIFRGAPSPARHDIRVVT